MSTTYSEYGWECSGIGNDPRNFARIPGGFNVIPNNETSSTRLRDELPLSSNQDLDTIIVMINSGNRKAQLKKKDEPASGFLERGNWEEFAVEEEPEEEIEEYGQTVNPRIDQYRPIPLSQLLTIKNGIYFGNLPYVPFDLRYDTEPGQCFNCRKRGHCRKQCLEPPGPECCENCGRREVNLRSCPRCGGAYVAYLKRSFERPPANVGREDFDERPATVTRASVETDNRQLDGQARGENQFVNQEPLERQPIATGGNRVRSRNAVLATEEGYLPKQTMLQNENKKAAPVPMSSFMRKKKIVKNKRLQNILALIRETHDLPAELRQLILRHAFAIPKA